MPTKWKNKKMIKFRQKQYTQWDDTDRLKQMKDSDILAEKKKSGPSRISGAFKGAGIGSTLGAVAGGIMGVKSGNVLGGMKRGAKIGGTVGAIGGATMIGNKQRSEAEFYNDRLEYAKRQALRREKKDWKTNMTGREGYTY